MKQAEIFLEKEVGELNIEPVPSARKALEALEESDYDAIVSDYQMPEMNGLEFLKVVREEKNNDIPFIVFTGKGREDVAMEALNLGADRYLQKGGNPTTQYGVLAQAIVQEVEHAKAKKEKEKVKAKLSSFVEESKKPAYILDENYRILFANQEVLEKHEMDRDNLIGAKLPEIHENKEALKLEK